MNKTLSLFLVCVVFVMLSACSDNIDKKYGLDPKNPVMITIWHYYNGAQKEAFDKVVDDFNLSTGNEKGIIVQAFSQGHVTDLQQAVMSASRGEIGAGDLPDIFSSYSDMAYEINQMGMICDLRQYLEQSEIDAFIPEFIAEATQFPDGVMAIFPMAKSTELLFINKTDYDKFVSAANDSGKYEQITPDMLSTWEGLNKIADIYMQYCEEQHPGQDLFLLGVDVMANFQIVANKQLGVDIINVQNGEASIDANLDVQKRIWDNMIVPYARGIYDRRGRFSSDDMKTGKSLMCIASSASAPYIPTNVTLDDGTSYPTQVSVLPYPIFEGADKYAIQQGAGMVVKKSDERHEYASVVFLKYLVDKQNIVDFAVLSSYLPPTSEALNQDMINASIDKHYGDSPSLKVIRETFSVAIQQLNDYKFYSSPPGIGSYDRRAALEDIAFNTMSKLKKSELPSQSDFDEYYEELSGI